MPTEESTNIDIAPFIDHSLLGNAATPAMVEQWCLEADRYGFATVCVNPCYVRLAKELLHQKRPQVCTVIGFPSGATTTTTKLYEAQEAIENGADELDVVINIGWLKAGKIDDVHREIAEICEATGRGVKAILELSLLTPTERELAAQVCMDAGANILKTGTGWCGGATVEDVRWLKTITRDRVGIKAAGGIRTHVQAVDLIVAGATRLGTSWAIDLLNQRDRDTNTQSEP